MPRFLLAVLAAVLLFLTQRAHAATDPLYDYIYAKCMIEFEHPAIAREKAAYYTPLIRRIADHEHVPEGILAALVWYESNYHPDCVSPAGALGLAQIMPFHFKSHGYRLAAWRDPEVNLTLACRLLCGFHRDMSYQYRGLPEVALWHRTLVAYNMGEGGVSRGIYRSRYSRAIVGDSDRMQQQPRWHPPLALSVNKLSKSSFTKRNVDK